LGYQVKTRERAFDLYLKHRNLEKVMETMRRDFPNLALSTLKRWCAELNWKERADRVDERRAQRADADVSPTESLLDEVKKIREQLQNGLDIADEDADTGQVVAKKITAKDAQAIYAFRSLVQVEAKLQSMVNDQASRGRETPLEVVLAALQKHPRFAALLDNARVRAELLDLIDELEIGFYKRSHAA